MAQSGSVRRKKTRGQRFDLAVPDVLAFAVQCHRDGDLVKADRLYRKILESQPEHPDALHFIGVLSHQRGNSEAAVVYINTAIALAPNEAGMHNNLGNVLLESGRAGHAADAYQKAVALRPDYADAYNNLGAALKAEGRFDEARAAYEKAIALRPEYADALYNLGNLMFAQRKIEEAVRYYQAALAAMPKHLYAVKLLGIAYYRLGDTQAATALYRQQISDDPLDAVATHMLAACSNENVPPRASDEYIEQSFDGFAASFDAKLEKLDYHAPQLVADAVAKVCGEPLKRLIALDAGCGTGLCGPLLLPFVARLSGVDLSTRMLDKARSRGTYDEIIKAELTQYLESQYAAFDLIVSADTLVYFGKLDGVLRAAHAALRPDGLLIFTVERAASESSAASGYRINPHGRYSHHRDYLTREICAAGFRAISLEPAHLRMEAGEPVAGFVITCTKLVGADLAGETSSNLEDCDV